MIKAIFKLTVLCVMSMLYIVCQSSTDPENGQNSQYNILYSSSVDDTFQVFMITLGKTSPVQLTFGDGTVKDFFFSPSGSKIYYTKKYYDPRITWTLFTINSDGSDNRELVTEYNLYYPCISPDGTKIAYIDNAAGKINLFDIASQTKIYLPEPDYAHQPQFSHIEPKIYYSESSYAFSRVNLDGSNPEVILGGVGKDKDIYEPVLSLDGSKIVFIQKDHVPLATYKLMIFHFGSEETIVLADSISYTPLAVSPDGMEIAFVSSRDGDDEIFSIRSDGTELVQLTDNSVRDWLPQYSEDGLKITYCSEIDGRYTNDIYIMNSDGTEQINITDSPENDHQPIFQPTQ